MKTFKIATWNVNSLRVRLPHVLAWLHEVKPDVLALQEIKMLEADFPLQEIEAAGYHAVVSGQKTYNGVAILSKVKPTHPLTDLPGLDDPQRRVLFAELGDYCILNLYIPNGESVGSDKYKYKLNWLSKLDSFLKKDLKKHQRLVIVGDFNIAPDEMDVHDPKQWEGSVLFSPPERQAFKDMLAVGFVDCFRAVRPDEKAYSWWDYRLNAYKRNMGLRIDHILASHAMGADCQDCFIDKAPRGWERPSDHAPVVAVFKRK